MNRSANDGIRLSPHYGAKGYAPFTDGAKVFQRSRLRHLDDAQSSRPVQCCDDAICYIAPVKAEATALRVSLERAVR